MTFDGIIEMIYRDEQVSARERQHIVLDWPGFTELKHDLKMPNYWLAAIEPLNTYEHPTDAIFKGRLLGRDIWLR